jgi:hypothetical protein
MFRSIWHEIQGQGCQKTIIKRLPRLQRHVNSLDIYVVSHGGVGSNAIIDYMEQNTSFHAKGDDEEMYRQSCHLGSPVWVPLVRQQATPTLVLLGDFWRALCSMKKRNWLRMNLAKVSLSPLPLIDFSYTLTSCYRTYTEDRNAKTGGFASITCRNSPETLLESK